MPDDPLFSDLASSPREPVPAGYVALPKLDRLMGLRDALVALKGPLADDCALREDVHNRLFNEEADNRVLGQVSHPLPGLTRLIPFG